LNRDGKIKKVKRNERIKKNEEEKWRRKRDRDSATNNYYKKLFIK